MNGVRNLPKSNVAISDSSGLTSQPWFRFFSLLFAKPPAAESVTVGPNPFEATFGRDGTLVINGGTVSLIEYVRDVSPALGVTGGQFVIRNGDSIRITFTVEPTVTFFPD